MSNFPIQVTLEFSTDQGEDCHLVYNDDTDNQVIAVFDGLGGKSAGFDGQTGGKIASQLAAKITQNILQASNFALTKELTHQIQTEICQQLHQQAVSKMPQSRLKGTLLGRRLCTTLALASFSKSQQDCYEIELAWIGDSRIYFLSPQKGLQQLTKDDLTVNKDPFEMIWEEPPMSQYLTADFPAKDWQLNFTSKSLPEAGCILACTDGCFQYQTPWDFETLLLETLSDSETPQQWQFALTQYYENHKHDDVSLLLSPLGLETFEDLKTIYRNRLHYLHQTYPSETSFQQLKTLWETYRMDYEANLIDVNLPHSYAEDQESTTISESVVDDENQTSDTTSPIIENDYSSQTKPDLLEFLKNTDS